LSQGCKDEVRCGQRAGDGRIIGRHPFRAGPYYKVIDEVTCRADILRKADAIVLDEISRSL
jgi:GMP synthase PP-ATPase subunit